MLRSALGFAHAFGQRYELPIPLLLFVLGGAGVVLISFLLVLPKPVRKSKEVTVEDSAQVAPYRWGWAIASFVLFAAFVLCGLFGSQEVAENIVPTLFWLVIWIAVPLSCGLIGDWTQRLNVFANAAKLVDKRGLRKAVLGREEPLAWPSWLGWWPAVVLFFIIACGELLYNETATKPQVTALSLLIYFFVSGFMGLLYGASWLQRGEVFNVLFNTWGRIGFFRFGAPGRKGFFGGITTPFEASPSRIAFTLLLLVSVAFDGLLSTPFWNDFLRQLPQSDQIGTLPYELMATGIFLLLAVLFWLVFTSFAEASRRAGDQKGNHRTALAGLLPSLLPISFAYLLAHNLEYLIVNGQLLFPLIGNPIGKESWPIHLAYPFNDSYEPKPHLLPSAFFWYVAVGVIIIAHIIAVLLAHNHLGSQSKDVKHARRAEYPWVFAMVAYTMLSLWLLAQPLVKEKTPKESFRPIQSHSVAFKKSILK